ncbi:sulfurtransferase [Deferribacter autotrophicus]|uniref:Sulfurtransferase n=1 Tax=Deferribacter autotrophicus TaxID=500465 RepID=A0A5A8F358_9BACT|nr:rhodanese-like domain-containing protein [Deferribacter autotrophicus]KAA0258565.1 sulfurtransferase [Deferribacter autotrophicus]
MKKNLLRFILALFVVFSLFFAGCAKQAQKPAAAETPKKSVKELIKEAGFEIVDYDYVKGLVGNGLRKFEKVVIIDARPERKYDSGHIPGAINIPDTKFNQYVGQLGKLNITKDTLLITYCGGFHCIKSYHDAKYLRDKGYKNIKVYLAGMPDWSKKSYAEITHKYAKKLLDKGVLFIDARPDRKWKKGTIPGAINIPDTKFMRNPEPYLAKLPQDKNTPIVVFCGGYKCVKSHNVARLLKEKYGYNKVYAYAGGLPEWKQLGYAVAAPGAKVIKKAVSTQTVGTIKPGPDEGTVAIEFFKAIIDDRPSNIHIVDVRSPEEFAEGHVKGAINIPVDDMYKKGCDYIINKLPKDGYIIFMCASGGRAGEMYFGLLEDCSYKEMNRLYFLDAHVDFSGGKCKITE